MTVREDSDEVAPLDDVAESVCFENENLTELLAVLVERHAERSRRDADIMRLRLGLSGARPQTLTRIADRYDLARDRVRQLHTRAVGQLVRDAAVDGPRIARAFAERYPLDARDGSLTRTLLTETYAEDTDLAAGELAYLKLRLAGHAPEDAKRVSGYVVQRIMAWQKKTRHQLSRLRDLTATQAPALDLSGVDWPASGDPAPMPGRSAREIDAGDDARGRFYLDKVGREVAYDSALQARLLRLLNADDAVRSFQEEPAALDSFAGEEGEVFHPTVVVRSADDRVVLVDVQPLGHIAFHDRRRASEAGRAYAHARGWGWLIWTGSRIGARDLRDRPVAAHREGRLRDAVADGPVSWASMRELVAEIDLDYLDFAALVLREGWRWERAPFALRPALDGRRAV